MCILILSYKGVGESFDLHHVHMDFLWLQITNSDLMPFLNEKEIMCIDYMILLYFILNNIFRLTSTDWLYSVLVIFTHTNTSISWYLFPFLTIYPKNLFFFFWFKFMNLKKRCFWKYILIHIWIVLLRMCNLKYNVTFASKIRSKNKIKRKL